MSDADDMSEADDMANRGKSPTHGISAAPRGRSPSPQAALPWIVLGFFALVVPVTLAAPAPLAAPRPPAAPGAVWRGCSCAV